MHNRPQSQPGPKQALLLDAVASAAMGALLAVLAGPLASLFGLPVGLLRWVGIALLPFAATLAYLATRPEPPIRGTQVVIACNALWVAASVLLLASGSVSPTALGTAFVLAQAGVVALLTVLEYASLRRVPLEFAT